MGNDRFPGQIEEISRRDAGMIKQINIDLSIVITDQPYHLAGNMFYLFDMPSGTYVDIKVNETKEAAIRYVEQTGLKSPFDTLYITTPAGQIGTAVLLYGTESPQLVELIDNRAAMSGDIEAIRDELRGDTTPENWDTEKTVGNAAAVSMIAANADRRACSIQSKDSNTGLIYVGFDNTVTTSKWVWQLLPGQAVSVDDYRGDLYARSNTAAQLVGWGEW